MKKVCWLAIAAATADVVSAVEKNKNSSLEPESFFFDNQV